MGQKLESMTVHHLVMIFDYLRPKGTITFRVHRKYNIPVVDIRFDGWYESGDQSIKTPKPKTPKHGLKDMSPASI